MQRYSKYFELELKDKIHYWDEFFTEEFQSCNENAFFDFLKQVILSNDEKVFCKREALGGIYSMVLCQKIRARRMIGFLIDEWNTQQESTVECLRLKYLAVFYPSEPNEIRENIDIKSRDNSCDIMAEANYQLGLIMFLNANEFLSENECKQKLKEAESLFEITLENEENRIDAEIMINICRYLKLFLQKRQTESEVEYKKIMQLIWKSRVLSIEDNIGSIFIGIGRIVSKIHFLVSQSTEKWVDFRKEFNNLCFRLYELKNLEYKENPFYEKMISQTKENSIVNMIEPVFKYNYKAVITKIDVVLCDNDLSDEEKEFLQYLKKIVNSEKKERPGIEFDTLKKMYPSLTLKDIDNYKSNIENDRICEAAYGLLEATKKYSYQRLLEAIVFSCVKIQGSYLCKTESEDERNDRIRNLLQAQGFTVNDQTRWGVSKTGKSSGEVDILVEEKTMPYAIIEALNLSSLEVNYLNLHIDKIFNYDTTGLKNNFILSYVTAKDFEGFWEKYKKHIKEHDYQYSLSDYDASIDNEFDYAGIKVVLTKHNRDGNVVGLYHICMKIPD